MPKVKTGAGFTLIELLVVLTLIALFVSITLPNYFGLQQRARDVRRKSDIATFVRVLEIYKVENKKYPAGIPNSARDNWSDSDLSPRDYIQIFDSFTNGFLPTDPLNNATYHYSYQVFQEGGFGCTKTFYILGIRKFEKEPKIGGWRCSQKDFGDEFDWAVGGYE